MKKLKKFKDQDSKRDSKRLEKKNTKKRKPRFTPDENRPPKYRHHYLNEEE